MNKLKISVLTLALLITLLYLHIRGMVGHLYMTYWFYDVILHFLGGASIALSTYCTAQLFNIGKIKNNLWNIVVATIIAGVAWEVFELYYDIAGYNFATTSYNTDTVKDLIMDTLGGITIFLTVRNK